MVSLLALALTLPVSMTQPLAAQSRQGGFSLPTPTPSPSSAPQGPADERAGVPIGPRVIRSQPVPQPTAPTPTPTPAPAEARAPVPSPTPTPTARVSRPSATPTSSATRTPAPSPTRSVVPEPVEEPLNEGAGGTRVPIGPDAAPGFEGLFEEGEASDPVGPDDWYTVDRSGETGSDIRTGGAAAPTLADQSLDALEAWDSTQNRLLAGIGLMALIGGLLALLMWRRRRREALVQSTPNTALASGIRRSIADQMPSVLQDAPDWAKGRGPEMPSAQPAETPPPEAQEEPAGEAEEVAPEPDPQPEPPPPPPPAAETHEQQASEPEPEAQPVAPPPADTPAARIDLELEITGGTRSFMMLTVEFRLEVANRSNSAVRDLTVAAKLACARKGGANGAPIAGGQPVAEIDRLGPQQSRVITGQLQLPLAEISPIKQGSTPLFIPLMHVTLEGKGRPAMDRSFVLGTPSAASIERVHPLSFDGPPGPLPLMRAQLIRQKQDAAPETA